MGLALVHFQKYWLLRNFIGLIMYVIKISNSISNERENILWNINRFRKRITIKVITLNGAVRKKWQKRVNYWEITIQHRTRNSYFRWIYFTNTVCNKVFSSLIVIVMLCNDCTNGGKVGEEGELCILCSYLARVHVYVLVFTNSYQCSPDG